MMEAIQRQLLPIEFSVPAVPVAQRRQYHRIVQPKSGSKPFVTNYMPKDAPVQAYKATVRLAASRAWRGAPLDGPISLQAVFVLPRPKTKIKKTKPNPRLHHTTKPDIDNLLKSLVDALTGLLWLDDKQICVMAASKFIASAEEQPHVAVRINVIEVS